MFGITTKLSQFMEAIATYEGWFLPGQKGLPNGSVSFRNNNPGNLRSSVFESTKKDGFSVFRNDMIGWLALQFDLIQKAKGNTVTSLNGMSTLSEFCEVWAPEADNNNPARYAEFIKTFCKLDDSFRLKDLLSE
jgi:hypothetical protein